MRSLLFLFLSFLVCAGVRAQNSGIQLDGVTGSVSLCHTDDFAIGDGFTLEAWIFASEWKAEAWQGSIINKDQQGPDAGFAFRAGKNGILSMVMSVDEAWFEVVTNPVMNANQWYHVAAVVNGAVLTLYINGEAQTSGTFTGTPTSNTKLVNIGASPSFPGRVWNGAIDEVRIWNVARTPAEIDADQTNGLTGTETGLVAYLPMNEGSGLVTANLADAACEGTFNGLTESAWVDGYSVPPIDVGVSAVSAPDVLSIFRRPVKTTVTIENYGSETVTDVPVALSVNGLPALTGTYAGSIAPGEAADYTFETPLDLTGNNTNLISANTTLAADPNNINDGARYRYRRPGESDNGVMLNILNEEKHNFGGDGQTKFSTVNLPQNTEDYGRLMLHLSVECPTGGCDPWDQPANISVITEDGELEIARFITPYGIECGGDEWTVDVTDFKSLLSGRTVIKSYIQVWGPSGWLLNADLEFIEEVSPVYQRTTPLWQNQYLVYGDPGISHDLPELTSTIASNTTDSRFRLTMTGHGQGNTDNAAEFSNQTHELLLNGETVANHNLWKDDCAENACADQLGTWLFSRAGWCPGQAVTPYTYDLGGDLFAGMDLTIDYELEDYVNLLNTDYNDRGHTEPHYRISAYLVEESDTHYASATNLRADSVRLTVAGADRTLELHLTNTGSEMVAGATVAYYVDDVLTLEETFTTEIAAGDTYVHAFSTVETLGGPDVEEVIAVVTAAGDENVSDDATNAYTLQTQVSVSNVTDAGVAVFPNPTSGLLQLQLTNEFRGATLETFDVAGRRTDVRTLTGAPARLEMPNTGVFFLRFQTTEGKMYHHKVVVSR